jgi:predicted O-methyltransferase YrrM
MMACRTAQNDPTEQIRGGHVTRPSPPAFDDTLVAVADVAGWMTDAQARLLWERAARVPGGGQIVEIGSYHGRSAIVLARAAADDVEVVAIDPHAGNDRGPQEIRGSANEGERDHQAFLRNLERAGVQARVRHLRLPSQAARQEVPRPIDLLYIDGAHRYQPARDDIRVWGASVATGGTILIHDAFCSVGVTGAIVTELLTSRDVRYVGRVGSLAEYRRAVPASGGRWRSAGHQLAELPWFVRSVLVKILLTLRLRPLTRLLGHRTNDWPY